MIIGIELFDILHILYKHLTEYPFRDQTTVIYNYSVIRILLSLMIRF